MKTAMADTVHIDPSGRPCVVAVSGTSGGGKTTLIGQTAAILGQTTCLYFDDYAVVDNDPAAILRWLEAGADPNEFKTPRFAAELRRVVAEKSGPGKPGGCILIEEPFGRGRSEMAPWIDLVVHLELPADIAMARRIVRSIEERQRAPQEMLDHLRNDLRTYLAAGRAAYTSAAAVARQGADLILDGMLPTSELAEKLRATIRDRRLQARDPFEIDSTVQLG